MGGQAEQIEKASGVWTYERRTSEDCLVLNVWTPTTDRGAKKPVFVSFHGGGFATGSGNAPGFDGKNLAHYADAVVVTVTHRLASFGYVNLVGAGAPDSRPTRAQWASSFSLPVVMRWAIGADIHCDATLRRIFGDDLEEGVRKLGAFLRRVGVETDPSAYGVSPAEWSRLVDKALEGERGRNFIGRLTVKAA